jgi:hypothetical protein
MSNDEELDSVEDAESEPAVDYAAKKRRIVMLLVAYSAIFGIISCFLPDETTLLDFIAGLPFLILGIMWCATDATERNHRIGQLMMLLLVLLFIVGMPIYLFQTRGLGAIKTIALAMVLVGTMFACAFITAFATLYVGDAAGLWEFA